MPHCFPHIARRALLRFLLTILLTGSAAPLFAQVTLKTPSNLHEVVEYDAATNRYYIYKRLGTINLEVPKILTAKEYLDYTLKRSMQAYYRQRNDTLLNKNAKDPFDFMDMKFNLGPADKLFGKGGIQIKVQGDAELSFGINYKNVQNPSLPESQRKTTGFDFDQKINVAVSGKVGDKLNLDLNYNTDATFDFDTKQLKLKYEGKEDEIVKLIEAGNVSMPSQNSLIRGASALFGLRTDLQFGKLKLQTVVSRQESESKTVASKGGAQTSVFDFSAEQYDENRHFFLAHYFRGTYDKNMAQLPNILSGVTINRIEVWVTNKRGNYDNPRNILALADLAEAEGAAGGGGSNPNTPPTNAANTLYQQMTTTYAAARDISQVTAVMSAIPGMEGGTDYEKIESARLLTSSEYTLNNKLGYLSLRQMLQPDEVLAVAFEYTLGGRSYQVGEFSTDIKDATQCLFVKLLKNTANSPGASVWDLMMKNVYSLNAYSVQQEKFQLNITYQSDTAGVYLRYLPEGKIARIPLLRVMNLDRLNSQNRQGSDGFFDFVEGYTVTAQNGLIYFPVVEPFGSHLRQAIGDDRLADKYVFQELYDSTRTVARQIAEKNKYRLTGEYRASNANEIQLGAMNVPPGSVRVTAGGVVLTENSDYTVDYTLGVVTILNQSLIDAGTSISVDLESNTLYSMQRKTMLGLNFTYDFSKDFSFGGTLMHLSEHPLTSKVAMGDEPISNTLWGFNATWKKQSQWLTNLIDRLPFVNATAPSSINLAYYPTERDPYNLDTDLNADGSLRNPEKRWGGMMRKLDTSDFEAANIEYVSFWLLDPFIYEEQAGAAAHGGDLYLNLGEVSEDILKDGKKSFENGLPADGDLTKTEETVWGRVPRDRSVVYAFDNAAGARRRQDVGLNGLSSEDERTFATYRDYLQRVQATVDATTFEKFYNDPAADNYHYFRGTDYDQAQLGILDRYKYYNNTEGNSTASEDSLERYDISAKTVPDVEDINQDNTLNETEKYFRYRIRLTPADFKVGQNYITDRRTASVHLRNGKTEEVNWYQFKVPVRSGEAYLSLLLCISYRFTIPLRNLSSIIH